MDGITDFFRRREAEPGAVPQTGWKQRAISEADERMEWRAEQRQKFGIEVSDEEYEQIGKVIAEAENPQDESYKIALAGQYAKWLGIPLSEAYLNVDVYTEAYTGKAFGEQDHKGAWEAIGDAFIMGNNTVRMGELGNLIRDAMQNGDEESARIYTEEYNALAEENFQRQDNVPRNIFVEAAKAGAQSAPYTGRVMLFSAFGSLAHPVAGAGAGFVYSSNIMRGQEFMELLNEGADLETANKVSIVSGALQGAVEATLGNVAGFAGAATKAVGRKALAGLSDGAIAKVAGGVARRFHFGAGKKLAVNVAMNYAKETVEEGAEEALQGLVSIVAHDVAAELGEYEIEPQTREEIGQRLAEAFKGGMLGSLILGLPAAGINSAVGVKELRTVREQARTMESEEAFVAATKDSPVFTQYGNNAESTAREVWKSYQRDRDERLRTEVEEQAEVTTAEGSVAEDETAETFRNEDGGLYTETESNGNEGTFKTGTPEEAENNTYGYINYTVDESANSVTIDEFKMAEGREGLRAEFYDRFAENFAGYDIRWEAKGNTAKRIKADLERANVSGRGLNYYASVDSVTDTRTRVRVARELKQYMPMLNDRQRAAGVTLLEAMAKGQGESISAFVQRNFGASIFGDVQEAEALAQAQGDTFQGKAGATTWRQFGNEVRAVIYAGENADFSTFAHELAHVYQRQLTGDLKTQAEQAFGVQNGDWLNSRYTFSDGTVQSAAEAFAYGFQDWLKTGKAPNEQMRNIFQKFAEFLASCLNALREHINLTKDITDTYDAMLKADDSVLAQAEQAVARQERERLAREAREAEQARQEAEAQSRAEAFDAGEVTVQEETRTEERTVQAEAQPETTVLSAPGTEGAVETMRDADASVAEKTETAMDAAEAEKAFEDVVFQLAGTQAIQNVARAETRARLEESLANANELELKFMRQNLDERTRAQRVKLATGWERNPDGDWIYETDDSQAVVKNQAAIRQLIANKQEMREGVTVGDLLDYPELYEMYPDVRNINVLLFNDRLAFRSMVTPRGILLNLLYFNGINGEKGLKASLLHEIQHWISATERGQGIDLYATRDLWNQAQRTAANPTPANINTMNEIARRVADDPGEFEPQIVSRRIALSGDARRRSLAFDDSRIVFQIAGISGAMNLDAAEESTRRMDDLNVAMEMEGAGKDARTIRLATGWERGVDRMWRYEIDDSTIDTKNQAGFLQEQTEAHRRFEELFDSGVADRVWNGTATDEERARFEELGRATTQEIEARHRRYEEAFAGYQPYKDGFLADFLDFPELYEAYPELREMRVRRKRLGEGEKGRVSRKDNEIWINELLEGYSFRSTLLHEIQHVIQDAEGFATGGSPGGFHKVEATQFDRALARYADYTAEELDGFSAEAVLDNYRLMLGDGLDSVSPEIDGIGRVEDEIERMVRNIGAERTRELIQSAKEAADADGKVLVDGRTYDSVYEAYRSIAGEVEARNVQSRMEYTTEERRQRLLAETADVAPEDQIVLFQMHEIQENREIDDIRAKYMGTERWMKAPNGKETNLSERQWLQVRTPSFKAWFGDWETKGAGASMAVDENGEPKVFYHGTRFAGFSVFNSTGKHHSNAPDGVSFFSDDRNTAMSYARASGDTVRLLDEDHVRAGIYEVFLNVREDDIGEVADFEGANWDGQAIGKYQAISQDGEVFFTEDGRQLFDSREEADEALENAGEKPWDYDIVEDPFVFDTTDAIAERVARANNPDVFAVVYNVVDSGGDIDVYDPQTEYIIKNPAQIKSATDNSGYFSPDNPDILFQSAYHGSPHNFDRFSTEAIGTGEGAQAFGWGLYFSNNRGIAEWYATKLAKGNEITYAGKKPEAFNKKMGELFANYVRILVRRVYDGTSLDYETAKKELIAYLQGLIDRNVLSEYGVEQEREKIAVIEKIDPKKIDVKKIRNLYTVEIPDGDYIKWDEPLPEEQERKIQAQAEKEGRAELAQQSYSFPMDFFITYRGESVPMLEDLPPSPTKEMKAVSMIATRAIRGGTSFYDEFDKARREGENDDLLNSIDPYLVSITVSPEGREDGRSVYYSLNKFFPNDKDKSLFLARAGFAGIDYPANSISGSWKDDGRNFVVFNDEDVSVRDHILFQTERELMEDAASFDTWQEWMEFYESFGKPEDNIVPEGADAAWYKGVWELSREWKKPVVMDTDTPERADEKFLAELSEPGVLEDFLAEADREVRQELWNPADAEEEAEIQAIQARQERIRNTLRHGSWLSNARRIAEGKELTPTTRQRLLTLAGNAPRDYRAIFAELMDREEYAVAEEDTTAAQMKKRYRLKGGDDIENKSPEQRRRIARELANEEVARRLESGEMPMGSELQGYIDSLNREIRENKKLYEDLLKETQADYSRISGWEDRQLLSYHDKLMEAKEKAEEMTAEIRRKVERGIRVTQKAQKEASTLRATYDSVFRKFEAMRKAMTVTAEVTDAIKRREDLSALRSRVKERQREKRLVEQEKKIRIQLVKRAMRRVSFEAVDYNKGRVITAVQRLFEPNLLGGVNRWIGTEGAYLRSVYSRWTTDDDFREELRRRLVRSPSGQKAIRLLDATDTIEKFNAWTKKERELLHRVVPGEDWIRELGLQELAEERSKIQLDIDERREVSGGMEKVTLVPSEELRRDIEEALGADLAALMSRPFAEWTTVEMERFAKRINELFREGRDELKAKNLVRKARAAEIRGLIEQAVKDTGIKIDDGEPEELKRRKLEKIDRILGRGNAMRGTAEAKEKGFRAWMLSLVRGYGGARLRSVARILDGQRDGVNVRELYVRENEAYNEKERRIAERTANIAGVMREAGISLDELFANVTIENFYAGRDVTFTVDELLFFREAAKDEHSRAAVAYGNIGSLDALLDEKARYLAMDSSDAGRPGSRLYAEICDKLLERVVKEADKLDEKFKVFASAIERDYAEQYERMNRASIDEWNMPVNRVDIYVPLVRLESNGDTNENRVREDMLGIAGMSRAGVDKGMTKSRIDIGALYQKPVETGLYKTWADSVARTEHFIAYSGYVRELNAVYRSRDAGYTRRLIEGRYGREMTRYIDSYIDETANPDATGARSELDIFVRNLRGKTATGYLAWKASSIIKQFATSPAPYLQFVSPAEYLASCLAVVRSGGKLFDAIKEKSPFMANRVMDVTVDIINEQLEKNRGKAGYALAKFNKLGMQGLETVDWVCVAPGWLACYRKKLAELEKAKDARYEERRRELRSRNPAFGAEGYRTEAEIDAEAGRLLEADNEKEAVDFADDCTRLCQPSARKADIAPFFKSSSEVAKALLQFQTSLNVIWNNIRYDLPYAVKNRQFRQVVGIVGGYVLAGVAVNMITDGLPEDDEDSEKIRRLVWYGTTQFTDAIPVFGSEVTKTVEKMLTGRAQFFGGGSDIFPMVDKFLAAAQNASGGDWDKALSKTIEGLGLLSGLPTSGAKELWRVVSGEPGIGAFWGRRE